MAQSNVEFTVHDLDSEDDVGRIEDELEGEDGILGVEIDQESGRTEILYDNELLAEERIKRGVREMGYEVE